MTFVEIIQQILFEKSKNIKVSLSEKKKIKKSRVRFNQLLDLRHENTKVEITEILHTNEEFYYFMFCNIVFVKNEIICLIVAKYNFLFENEMNLFEKCQNHIEFKKKSYKNAIQLHETFSRMRHLIMQ